MVQQANKQALLPLSIFFLLTSVYLLTYSGLFRSIDELVLWTMADRLAQARPLDPHPLQFAIFYDLQGGVMRREPLDALLILPLYLLGWRSPAFGSIQTSLLFNIFVTAAAGSVLWVTLHDLEHRKSICTIVTMLASLGTMAWPYSRTLFREPLLGLLLLSAFWGWRRYRQQFSPQWAGITLITFVFAVGVKIEALLLFAIFPLALIWVSPRAQRPGTILASGLAGIVALGIFGISLTYRFGTADPLAVYRGYYATGLGQWTIAFYGFTLSPGKGLFLYSPLLFLGFLGLIFPRREVMVHRVLLATALLFISFYALSRDWFGGTNWGPRYLVPLSWILAIPLAELWSWGKRWRLSIAAVALFSIALQFVASTADWGVYYRSLFERYPDPENGLLLDPGNWWLSPVIGQFFAWRPEHFDFLWGRGGQVDWPISLTLLALLIINLAFLTYSHAPHFRLNPGVALGTVTIFFILGTAFFLKEAYGVNSSYPDTDTPTMRVLAERINSPAGRNLVISISEEFSYNFFLNFQKGSFDHYWFSQYQKPKESILEPALADADRIFLIADRIPHRTPLQRWLDRHAVRYQQEWVGSYLLMAYYPP